MRFCPIQYEPLDNAMASNTNPFSHAWQGLWPLVEKLLDSNNPYCFYWAMMMGQKD